MTTSPPLSLPALGGVRAVKPVRGPLLLTLKAIDATGIVPRKGSALESALREAAVYHERLATLKSQLVEDAAKEATQWRSEVTQLQAAHAASIAELDEQLAVLAAARHRRAKLHQQQRPGPLPAAGSLASTIRGPSHGEPDDAERVVQFWKQKQAQLAQAAAELEDETAAVNERLRDHAVLRDPAKFNAIQHMGALRQELAETQERSNGIRLLLEQLGSATHNDAVGAGTTGGTADLPPPHHDRVDEGFSVGSGAARNSTSSSFGATASLRGADGVSRDLLSEFDRQLLEEEEAAVKAIQQSTEAHQQALRHQILYADRHIEEANERVTDLRRHVEMLVDPSLDSALDIVFELRAKSSARAAAAASEASREASEEHEVADQRRAIESNLRQRIAEEEDAMEREQAAAERQLRDLRTDSLRIINTSGGSVDAQFDTLRALKQVSSMTRQLATAQSKRAAIASPSPVEGHPSIFQS